MTEWHAFRSTRAPAICYDGAADGDRVLLFARGPEMVEQPFEKLGAFYLGRVRDLERNTTTSEYVLYDSKDLTTHALCVGMTGSGKTGLCISLLEEAGIDGIPAIVVDPKGDIGNLLLTFPDLRPEDFRPWVDEAEAARQGQTPDEYAQQVADAVAGRAGRLGTGRGADPAFSVRRRPGDLHAGQQCRSAVDDSQVLLRAARRRWWRMWMPFAIVYRPPRPVCWRSWVSMPIRSAVASSSWSRICWIAPGANSATWIWPA